MPLQLEGRGQFVDAFIEHFHYAIVAAVERDLANPHCAPRVNLHGRIRCHDPGATYPSKAFSHAFEDAHPIVAPLIVIIVSYKIGHSLPVSVFDRMKEILGVQPNLMLRSPEPDQI